jgi:hypothetical protein
VTILRVIFIRDKYPQERSINITLNLIDPCERARITGFLNYTDNYFARGFE